MGAGRFTDLRPDQSDLACVTAPRAIGRTIVGSSGSGSNHFTGLHAGASIRVDTGTHPTGGVACILTENDAPTHFVTAGHLFPVHAGPVPVLAALAPHARPEQVGILECNLLDDGDSPIDAALVRLNPRGASMARHSGEASNVPRLHSAPFPSALVGSIRLRILLSMTGEYVTELLGQLLENDFTVDSHCREPHIVRNVLTTNFAQNSEGNSGTLLLSDDGAEAVIAHAVGIAVGYADETSLYEPLDRALAAFTSGTDRIFRIWSNE